VRVRTRVCRLIGVAWGVLCAVLVIVPIGVVITGVVRGIDVEIHIDVEINSPLLVVICGWVRLVWGVLGVARDTVCGCWVVYMVGGCLLGQTLEILCFVCSYGRVWIRRIGMADRFQLGSTVPRNLSFEWIIRIFHQLLVWVESVVVVIVAPGVVCACGGGALLPHPLLCLHHM